MSIKNITISEACDGFTISISYKDTDGFDSKESYWFSQEDTKEELVSVFKTLGFNSNYEEDY